LEHPSKNFINRITVKGSSVDHASVMEEAENAPSSRRVLKAL
jgi:hypothetical protein